MGGLEAWRRFFTGSWNGNSRDGNIRELHPQGSTSWPWEHRASSPWHSLHQPSISGPDSQHLTRSPLCTAPRFPTTSKASSRMDVILPGRHISGPMALGTRNLVKWSEVKVVQSCPTLCDPMDYTVCGILQTRILEWVAYPFSSGSSWPRNQTGVSWIAVEFFTN